MSQLQFQVSIVGANARSSKVTVPAYNSTTGSNPLLSTQYQLPCSPIAPARVVLKNNENYPVYFKVFTDRSISNQQQHNNNEPPVYVHPTRGAVKPRKSITIAVVLAPPPNPTAHFSNSKENTPTNREDHHHHQRNQATPKQHQRRSHTPKKVSFAGESNNPQDEQDNEEFYSKPTKPICRMKIDSVIILSGNVNKTNQHHFADNHDHDDDEKHNNNNNNNNNTDEELLSRAALKSKEQQHRELISVAEFERQWSQGVSMPSRVFDIISVKPAVTRDEYLRYLISRRLKRCDRLVHRCVALENRCDTALRLIRDLREGETTERMRELSSSLVTTTSGSNNKADNRRTNIHIVTLVVGLIASFVAGFSL